MPVGAHAIADLAMTPCSAPTSDTRPYPAPELMQLVVVANALENINLNMCDQRRRRFSSPIMTTSTPNKIRRVGRLVGKRLEVEERYHRWAKGANQISELLFLKHFVWHNGFKV
jgi:hypothetical protein